MNKLFVALLILAAAILCATGIGALSFGVRLGALVLAVGLFLFILALFSGLLRRKLPRFYKWLSRTVTCGIIIVGVLSIVASIQILSKYFDDNAPDGAVMIVLGCGLSKVDHTSPSLMLARRLVAAANYLTQNPETICVVSGGQGQDEYVSEASAMAKYLIRRGIHPDRIILEDTSTSTYENIAFTKTIIEENNLFGDSEELNLIVVTDGFHQFRAQNIAEKQGFTCYTISAKAPAGLIAYYWLREICGIALQVWL